jgi:hypothetical protein
MNLTSMLSDLYRRFGYASAPATDVGVRFTAFLNEALQDVIAEQGLGEWITRNVPPVTFASVASTPTYGLSMGTSRITAITERTNDLRLTMRPFDWYRYQEPDPTSSTGTPTVWVPLGFIAVSQQPAAATGLWAVSTSASDITQTVRLETVRTGGLLFSGSLAINGTTRVQLGSATTHEQVTKFYLSAAAVGDIQLYDAAVLGNLLATIPIGQAFSRYEGIALWPTPSAAITYQVDGERNLVDMANGTDEPPFPARFHRCLVEGAIMREHSKRGDTGLATMAARNYDRIIGQFRYFVTCPPDFLPARQTWHVEQSRFGAQFPATRWPY